MFIFYTHGVQENSMNSKMNPVL